MPGISEDSASPRNLDQLPSDGWSGIGDLLSLATERLSVPVEGIQDSITDRWFSLAGSRGTSIRRALGAYTGGIYGSIRAAGSVVGGVIDLGAVLGNRRLGPLWSSPAGNGIQGVANAVWGDELARRRNGLRIELGLRDSEGQPIGRNPVDLQRAYPNPRRRLLVLIHGLGETERCWRSQTEEAEDGDSIGELLAGDSFTPLTVRYNTGKHIFENGASLAGLLEQVVSDWPREVEEVALVGSSMGGLVARSSVLAGRSARQQWSEVVKHVVTVGSPHLGSPLEKVANLISWGLRKTPESRPLSGFLNDRSVGIKDLRYGAIRREDWGESDLDAVLGDTVGDTGALEGVQEHFIAGVITSEPGHPMGALLGDLVVRVGSGIGRGRRRRIEAKDVRVIGRRRHFDLMSDPQVHEQVREWLGVPVGSSRQ
jgi:pimeloyl-ACP methyl ester carboxylesterase